MIKSEENYLWFLWHAFAILLLISFLLSNSFRDKKKHVVSQLNLWIHGTEPHLDSWPFQFLGEISYLPVLYEDFRHKSLLIHKNINLIKWIGFTYKRLTLFDITRHWTVERENFEQYNFLRGLSYWRPSKSKCELFLFNILIFYKCWSYS